HGVLVLRSELAQGAQGILANAAIGVPGRLEQGGQSGAGVGADLADGGGRIAAHLGMLILQGRREHIHFGFSGGPILFSASMASRRVKASFSVSRRRSNGATASLASGPTLPSAWAALLRTLLSALARLRISPGTPAALPAMMIRVSFLAQAMPAERQVFWMKSVASVTSMNRLTSWALTRRPWVPPTSSPLALTSGPPLSPWLVGDCVSTIRASWLPA